MEISKIPNWERSLFDYIQAAETRPFLWGNFDCCLFPAGAIESMTGYDPAAIFRGTYSTEEEASEMLEQASGMQGMAASMLEPIGLVTIPPAYAQRGDIGCLSLSFQQGLITEVGAVCIGGSFAVLEQRGLRSIPLTAAIQKLSAKVWGLR